MGSVEQARSAVDTIPTTKAPIVTVATGTKAKIDPSPNELVIDDRQLDNCEGQGANADHPEDSSRED